MNHSDLFAQCWKRASSIVQAYRDEAPEGCDPVNTWVAVGVAVVGTTVSAVSAHQKAKAAKKAGNIKLPSKGAFDDAYGDVPKAAIYNPVDIDQEQLAALLGNKENLPAIQQLMRGSNDLVTADALRRASKLIPGYRASMDAYGSASGDLLRGNLPFEDVMGIVRNRADLTNSLGVPGTGGPATLRDLGLSRLDAIKTGGGMLQDMVNIAERVSPRASYLVPKDLMVSPGQRIETALIQHQLQQNSEQNFNNLAASGDPSERAALEAEMGVAPQRAAAAAISPGAETLGAIGTGISSIGGGLAGGMGSMGSSGGSSGAGASFGSGMSSYQAPSFYSGAYANKQGWAAGPQAGTYYVPRTGLGAN